MDPGPVGTLVLFFPQVLLHYILGSVMLANAKDERNINLLSLSEFKSNSNMY